MTKEEIFDRAQMFSEKNKAFIHLEVGGGVEGRQITGDPVVLLSSIMSITDEILMEVGVTDKEYFDMWQKLKSSEGRMQ